MDSEKKDLAAMLFTVGITLVAGFSFAIGTKSFGIGIGAAAVTFGITLLLSSIHDTLTAVLKELRKSK